MSYKKTTLKNGLRIITLPQKNTQAVTVLVLVGTGSKYEKKEENGISHFLEHMYFKGTKKRPSPLAIAETLDRVGGIYNAFTGQEYTGYFAKVATSHFELALDWVSDIFLNSLLPENEIEKEKGVIIEEINMYYDHPMDYIGILWPKLLYGDQPAGWEIAGRKETIQRMNREILLDYMKSQYVASNTVITIAGNFDEKRAISLVGKYFSGIGTKKPKNKPPVIEKQNQPGILCHFRKTDQTHLALGVRGYNLFHPQRYTIEILGIILGGMMSSRLFEIIRTKMGIAYYIKTVVETDPDTGYLVSLAGVDNQNVEKAIKGILREYKKISELRIPEKELRKAKDFLKGKMILELESSDALASFYGGQEILEKKILTPKEIFRKIDQVSRDDILKVAREIFQPSKLNLALIGPFKEKNIFEKILNQY
jgi:predicted Zn-dependent peptidase